MAVAKNNKLDWLPPGWKVEDKVKNGRKVRCYINVKSSKRLYSKSSVLRYIRKTRMNNQRSRSQLSNGPLTRSSGNMELPLSKEPNDCFDSLPPGWIMEVKTRKRGETAGVKYKCYIETSTGNTFYSKPEVSRYLKGKEQSTGSSGIKKSGATGDSLINGSVRPLMHHNPDREQELPQHPKSDEEKSQPSKIRKGSVRPLMHHNPDREQELPQHPKSDDEKSQPSKMRKVIVETVVDEGLPPGWIKEIRIKNTSNGVRRDKFYNDTTTGYVFRSRLEVLRYLETGEISKHAYKRKDGGRNIIQSMQGSPSAATVRSNNTKGKEPLEGSSFPNRGESEVGNTGSDTVLAGNNALLDLGADVDSIPIETQKPEGNENDVMDSKISERKLMRNRKEMVSSRRSSKRLAGIEIEHVTHSLAIEKVLRSANKKSAKSEIVPAEQSQKAPDVINVGSPEGIVCHYTESAAVPSKNEFVGAEQSKDKEECGKSSSRRKPERNRKERIWPRRSSKLLAGIEVVPVTPSMATKRVLRSTSSKPAQTETIPSSGSEQGEQAKEVPLVSNVGSQTEPATVPLKNELLEVPLVSNVGSQEEIVCHYTEPATVPLKNDELLEAELIKDKEECGNRSSRSRERKPKRNRKEIVSPHRSSKLLAGVEVEPVITHSKATQRVLRSASSKSAKTEAMPSLGSEQGEQAKEAPLVINYPEIAPAASILPEDQTVMMIDFSRNTVGGQMTTVEPSRSNVEDHRIKEPPKRTDELTTVVENNGREKEQQDSHFSFPWSDPCIEFAYKTLTGALPLDDSLAIHDYVQHQIRTCSNNSKHFTLPDSRPSGFSLNTLPSNSSNSFTFPDPGPPGFSRTLPDARPPGFPRNVMPSNSPAFPDARPPGFPRNIVPSNSGSVHAIPDARPPGFCLNAVPSNHGNNLTLPDSGPPGFSRSSVSPNNLAIPDGTPPGFSRTTIPPDVRPPGFSWSAVPSDSGNNPALPDARPPGFPWSNTNPALPDAKPPGFSWSSVPSDSGNNPALPDARSPPGFSWSGAPSDSGNNSALPDARSPPGFPWSNVPSNSGITNPALPDAKPPGFSWSNVPSNSGLPDARSPPGFSWSGVPSDSGNNSALPDARSPPGFSWSSVPSNSDNNPALPDARSPPGFPWSSVPSNSGITNPALPDTKPPGFSWSSFPSDSGNTNPALPNAKSSGFPWSNAPSNSGIGINLNVALPDYGPPGFSEKIPPSSQQQPADFPLQGTMFSPWNHRN